VVIDSYTSLIARIQSYLVRGDLAAEAPGLVQVWEEAFYRQPLNHGAWLEQPLNGTIAAGVIAVPADYLNLKNAYVNASPSWRLDFVSVDVLLGRYPRGSGTGQPGLMARERENFIFGPAADSGYNVKGTYYGKPTPLRSFASDAAANWLILNAPDLVLFGSLVNAESFVKNDSRVALWQQMYSQALKDYRDLISAEQWTMPSGEVLA